MRRSVSEEERRASARFNINAYKRGGKKWKFIKERNNTCEELAARLSDNG